MKHRVIGIVSYKPFLEHCSLGRRGVLPRGQSFPESAGEGIFIWNRIVNYQRWRWPCPGKRNSCNKCNKSLFVGFRRIRKPGSARIEAAC